MWNKLLLLMELTQWLKLQHFSKVKQLVYAQLICIFNFAGKLDSVSNEFKIVLTGAFLPESFKESDADFNVGLAIGKIKLNFICKSSSRNENVTTSFCQPTLLRKWNEKLVTSGPKLEH